MDLGLDGKTAIVTGGSLGIGRAAAACLAGHGASVVLIARDGGRLAEAAAEIAGAARNGARVLTITADLSSAGDHARAMAEAAALAGPIDILINNAGATPAGSLAALSDEVWGKSIALKLMGYVRATRAVLPSMRERGWGRVVNVIGVGGVEAIPGYAVGGAVNAALLNLTKTVAKEVARDGITVNGINPGPVDTPRWHTLIAQRSAQSGRSLEEERALSVARVPSGRPGTPEEIAQLVAFVCSVQAAHINGALINIDGGQTSGI